MFCTQISTKRKPFSIYSSDSLCLNRSNRNDRENVNESNNKISIKDECLKRIHSAYSQLIQNIWNQSVQESCFPLVNVAINWILNELYSPYTHIPILFAVVGSSDRLDIRFSFDMLYQEIQKRKSTSNLIIINEDQKINTVKTLLNFLKDNVRKTKKNDSSINSKTVSSSVYYGCLISGFISVIKRYCSSLIIIVENLNSLTSQLLFFLIKVCHRIRSEKSIGIPVALILGLSISIIQPVISSWPVSLTSIIISTGIQICNVKNIVYKFTNLILTDITLNSFLDIPRTYLSSLIDDMSSTTNSAHFVKEQVDLYTTILLYLSPSPSIFTPIKIEVKFNNSSSNEINNLEKQLSHDSVKLKIELKSSNLASYDALQDSSLFKHIRFIYHNILQIDDSIKNISEIINNKIEFLLILRLCSNLRQSLLFALLFPVKIYGIFSLVYKLPIYQKELYSLTNNVPTWFQNHFDSLLNQMSVKNLLEHFWDILDLNNNHLLLLELNKLEHSCYKIMDITGDNFLVTVENKKLLHDYLCLIEEKYILWKMKDSIPSSDAEEVKKQLWHLIEIIILSVVRSYKQSFSQKYLLPTSLKIKVWKMTISFLKPTPINYIHHILSDFDLTESFLIDFVSKKVESKCLMKVNNPVIQKQFFTMDLKLLYYILMNIMEKKVAMVDWYKLYCLLSILVIQFLQNDNNVDEPSQKSKKKLELQSNTRISICAKCLYTRFCMCIEVFVLLGLIVEPRKGVSGVDLELTKDNQKRNQSQPIKSLKTCDISNEETLFRKNHFVDSISFNKLVKLFISNDKAENKYTNMLGSTYTKKNIWE